MTTIIAVVEDDPDQRENYSDVLTAHGYEVRTYPDRPTAEAAFNLELPDLAMLDIMLGEDMNGGFDLCMQLRNMSSTLPIIFLTARDSDADRISSQRMTAWDYITKPVSLEFLVARVHALLKIADQLKTAPAESATISVGSLELNENSMLVHWKGKPVNLTLTEFWIIESLTRNPGHVKTYDGLSDVTRQGLVERNTINGYIRRIRNKFRTLDDSFDRIQTVHGTGYKWEQDST
ncbi:response regulator [Arenicellales bacterium IMCC57338]